MTQVESMTAALLFIGGVLALGLIVVIAAVGAWAWSRAIAETHRARAHGIAADVAQREATQTFDAVDEVVERKPHDEYRSPTEAEMRAGVLAERENEGFTTTGNEGIEETPPIDPGGFYREVENLDGRS